MIVRFKKLRPDAIVPTKAHESDAGFDLYATSRVLDDTGCIVYGTGIALEIPRGYVGLIFPRSSISKQDIMLTNAVGVIDSGYRGEVMAKFKATLSVYPDEEQDTAPEVAYLCTVHDYRVGERICQLMIIPYPEIEFVESDELDGSDRGDGGYGSTGR